MAILCREAEILVVIEGENPFTFENLDISMEIDENVLRTVSISDPLMN